MKNMSASGIQRKRWCTGDNGVSLSITLNEQDVFALFGDGNDHSIHHRTKRIVRDAIASITAASNPHACWRLCSLDKPNSRTIVIDSVFFITDRKCTKVLQHCNEAAVFAITLGPNVDSLLQSVSSSINRAYIFDKVASFTAEYAATKLENTIASYFAPEKGTTYRYSPGYCDWPLSEQQNLFSLLPDTFTSISLSDNCLMTPRKSISGILGIGTSDAVKNFGNACISCIKRRCLFRRK